MNRAMKRLSAGIFLSAVAGGAHAGGHVYAPYPEVYVRECASCHVAYPPELLTQAGWRQILGRLGRHFGVDASIDAKTATELSTMLVRRAGTRGSLAPVEADARLTRTPWFVREHGETGAMPAARAGETQKRQSGFSECTTCHRDAATGDFSERGLRSRKNREE